jgi:hypothetical protein
MLKEIIEQIIKEEDSEKVIKSDVRQISQIKTFFDKFKKIDMKDSDGYLEGKINNKYSIIAITSNSGGYGGGIEVGYGEKQFDFRNFSDFQRWFDLKFNKLRK